eukprot:TRINITY_DN3435_c0_g1_i2.p1 TRINITY_DN3435_c0_g1~~TRINITY_DN3435_c0_g1_i2.p1  ORF type:complete len:328 (-),score=175.38 TRINITY_DN3435_c0_g1_i2:65-1048(-)
MAGKKKSNVKSAPEEEKKEEIEKIEENEQDEESEEEEQTESRGKIVQRHKKEVQELKKKCEKMMHSFSKNDKKAKKETQDAIKKLEEELKKKQEGELKLFDEKDASESKENEEEDEVVDVLERIQLKQEKNRKKAAAKLAAEQELERQIAEEKKNAGATRRDIENQQLNNKLHPLGLGVYDITPDGNCLYAALSHQLQLSGTPVEKEHYKVLRELAAKYMLSNPDDFLPFLDSTDGGMMSPEQFQAFCEKTAKTAAWGGQLELRALANSLKRPITVYTADPNAKNIEMGEEFNEKPLLLSYHRHAFGLGEHYNSIVPYQPSKDDEER